MAQSTKFPFWNPLRGTTPSSSSGPAPAAGAAPTPTNTLPKPDPAAPLQSTWHVRAAAGEPRAVVRVRNLQSTMSAGRDAWGRASKTQPVLLSSEISLSGSFERASEGDTVAGGGGGDGGTVHYGTLSKALLGGMADFGNDGGVSVVKKSKQGGGDGVKKAAAETPAPSAAAVFELLWVKMTGRVVDGSQVALPADQVPFLDARVLRSLSLTLHLPKASLLGAGVSLTTTACFKDARSLDEENDDDDRKTLNPLRSYARCLRLHELRVPTLIGVNDNERTAKQMVVADIEIDRFDIDTDIHTDLERLVVDTLSDSSFETLEALGTHIGNKILREFRISGDADVPVTTMAERGWQVRIRLEKPIAVPFADCPSVEILMGGGESQ